MACEVRTILLLPAAMATMPEAQVVMAGLEVVTPFEMEMEMLEMTRMPHAGSSICRQHI